MKLFYHFFIVFGLTQIIFAADYNTNRKPTIRPQTGNEAICQKVLERVGTLTSSDQQQLQKLEIVDSRLTHMEMKTREHIDMLREEIKEISKQMTDYDWDNSKSVRSIDSLRGEIEAMRQNLDNGHSNREVRSNGQELFLDANENLKNLTSMVTSMGLYLSSVGFGVYNIEQDLKSLKKNVSSLLQVSREIQRRQHSQPSKQFLIHTVNNVRSDLCESNRRKQQSNAVIPSNCIDDQIRDNDVNKIQINQNPILSFYVKCYAHEEFGSGWTVILHRFEGSVNFYRHWFEYKNGFGNIAGEFFIGLDKLYAITSSRLHELLILMQDFDDQFKYARYSTFAIGSEKEMYPLQVLGEYNGTGEAGDSLRYSASHKFSTFDNDNDGWVEGNCAQSHTGGWWYNACETSNLMGQYLQGPLDSSRQFQGMYWEGFRGSNYSLKAVTMLIRPVPLVDDY